MSTATPISAMQEFVSSLPLDEARRIASNIAKLPALLSEGGLSVGFGRPSRFNRAGDNRHG